MTNRLIFLRSLILAGIVALLAVPFIASATSPDDGGSPQCAVNP